MHSQNQYAYTAGRDPDRSGAQQSHAPGPSYGLLTPALVLSIPAPTVVERTCGREEGPLRHADDQRMQRRHIHVKALLQTSFESCWALRPW